MDAKYNEVTGLDNTHKKKKKPAKHKTAVHVHTHKMKELFQQCRQDGGKAYKLQCSPNFGDKF